MEVLDNEASRRIVDARCLVLLTAFLCLVLNYVCLSSLATLIEARRCIQYMEESELLLAWTSSVPRALYKKLWRVTVLQRYQGSK